MADYKVGNLQIVFNAVDETSKAFEDLSKNLRAVRNAVLNLGKIGASDMEAFGKVIETVTAKFSPLLNDIKGAEAALADFNGILQRIGARRISTIVQAIEQLNRESKEATESVSELGSIVSMPPQLSEVENEIRGIWETFSEKTIKSTLALKAQEEQLLKNKIAFLELKIANNDTEYSTEELRKELERLQEELGNNEKATKKNASGWKKFIKSIGRIAMYRTIRRVIQLITQSITESIQEFAKLDDNVNNIVSSATSSLKVIQLSFGATLLPILEAITPILNQIAVGFANVANTISASMATGETFWAINAKAIQDYREQLNKTTGTLASFDKIQSLNKKDEFSFFEEKKVEDFNKELGVSKINLQSIQFMLQGIGSLFSGILKLIYAIASSSAVQTIIGVIGLVVGALAEVVAKIINVLDKSGLLEPILWGILAVLVYIGATKAITWLSNTQFITWINKLAIALKTNLSGALKTVTTDLVGLLGTTQALVFSIGALVGALAYFISNAGQLSTTAKVLIPLISVLTGAFAALAVAKAAAAAGIAAPVKALITAGALVAAITMVAGTAIAKKINSGSSSGSNASIPKFADGGSVPYGTLFYADEAGAETVTVGNSGRTEVTNVSQMENALYNALVRYGRENRGVDGAINVNIDGQKVFEATRRVANRRGLDFSKV